MTGTIRLRPEALEWRAVQDEVVAVDLSSSRYLGVNPAGAMLWGMLAEGATRTQLESQLIAQFGIDVERAAQDVDAFLARLRELALLER